MPSQRNKRRKIQYGKASTAKWEHAQQCDKQVRRSTRIKYRKLAEQTQNNRAFIVDPMQPHYLKTLEEQQNIYQQVCHPNEAFMDIEQANNMSKILKEQTRSLANEQFTITPQDYIAAILRKFGQNNGGSDTDDNDDDDDDDDEPQKVDWSRIGQNFAPWFLTIPPIQFMLSPNAFQFSPLFTIDLSQN